MDLVKILQLQGRVPVTVFQLQDRIHLGNFSELENTAKEAYDRGARNIVIDLSKTDSMTSIGLRALVVIHKILAKSNSGKHLKLAGLTTSMREIMQVAGLSQFIDSYDTVDEAVATF